MKYRIIDVMNTGIVRSIGIPECASEREPSSDEKIMLHLSDRLSHLQSDRDELRKALETVCEQCRNESRKNGKYTICEKCEVAKALSGGKASANDLLTKS